METATTIAAGFALMGLLLLGATVTGKTEELCTAMGGHYRPVAPPADQCPDGKWRNLFTRPVQQAEK